MSGTSGDRISRGVGARPDVRWRGSVCMVMLVSCSDLESKPGPGNAKFWRVHKYIFLFFSLKKLERQNELYGQISL